MYTSTSPHDLNEKLFYASLPSDLEQGVKGALKADYQYNFPVHVVLQGGTQTLAERIALFAEDARRGGLSDKELLQKIQQVGQGYKPESISSLQYLKNQLAEITEIPSEVFSKNIAFETNENILPVK